MDPTDIQASGDVVGTLRSLGGAYTETFPVVRNEYTNWLDEQRAITETATLADLSHHMTAIRIEGPDARRLLRTLAVNDFDEFPVGKAKQVVMCNPSGYIMGDGPILRLGDDVFYGPGFDAANWVKFHVESGDYDVDLEIEPPTSVLPGDPEKFVYQVQGPKALDVLEQVTDDDLSGIGFYRFSAIELAGYDVIALGHGMSTEPGFEFHGPYEAGEAVRDAILEAGEAYGIRRLGLKAYHTLSVKVGWFPPGVKPIYDLPEMADYREWLTGDMRKAPYSIDGSYDSEDITDYYISPIELNYGKLVDLDHDFVGKEAIAADLADPKRQLVTLTWDDTDVVDVYGTLFESGPTAKFMNLPRIGWARRNYDAVLSDDELIGISHSRSYEWDVRSVVSLARINVEHSEPGTEVTVVWGEPDSPNPTVEDHERTAIKATVGPVPYGRDQRKSA